MPQHNFFLPLLIPERRLVRAFPQPYNEFVTPYHEVQNFSTIIQNELKISHLKLKFRRPCKVIFIGDVAVGKTTVVHRFCYDQFQSVYKATIGVDFEIENFDIMGQNFCLEMWDTAGQERFKCIAQAYYRNANVIVVVFDMSRLNTLDTATTWLRNALNVNYTKRPLIFLVGTKSDLLSKDEFKRVEKLAFDIADGIKAEYWSVSARTGFKIVDLFQRIAALAFETASIESIMDKDLERQTKTLPKKSSIFDFNKYFVAPERVEVEKKSTRCAC